MPAFMRQQRTHLPAQRGEGLHVLKSLSLNKKGRFLAPSVSHVVVRLWIGGSPLYLPRRPLSAHPPLGKPGRFPPTELNF